MASLRAGVRWRLIVPGIYVLLCLLGYTYFMVMSLPGVCRDVEGFRCAVIPMIPLVVLGLPWVILFGQPGASDVFGIGVPIIANLLVLFGVGLYLDARKKSSN